jgi:transposase
MTKRKYTHIKTIEPEIISMRKAEKNRREIADHFGLDKIQIKNWINRYDREVKRMEAGIIPRPKGRPQKDAAPRELAAEQAYEINRLRMENKLLRHFYPLKIVCTPY